MINKNIELNNVFAITLLVIGITLVNTIPLQNTIALRNVCLYLGAFIGFYFIHIELQKNKLGILIVPITLFLTIIWVFLLYLYFPTLKNLQIAELKSLWPRSFAAIIFGTGLAVVLIQKDVLARIFFANYFVLAIVNIIFCIIEIYYKKTIPVIDYFGIFITKAPAAYFLIFPFFTAVGYLDRIITDSISLRKNLHKIMLAFALIILCIFSQYLMQSLNGLLTIFLILFLQSFLLFTKRTNLKTRDRFLLLLGGLFIIISFSYIYSAQNDRLKNKLINIISDAQIGLQIDAYPQWRYDSRDSGLPIIVDGRVINGSTFYRVASIKKGIEIIVNNPLGAGFTFLPYGYYLKNEYPNARADHTHSGWIDYTLGVGVPGIILMLVAISYGLYNCITNRLKDISNPMHEIANAISMWALLGLTILWMILEVSEREYIEYLFFSICLFSSIAYLIHEKK